MRELLRSLRRRVRAPQPPAPLDITFGRWADLDGSTLAVCHPEWRGVRTAAHAFGDPVVETADAGPHAEEIADAAAGAGITTVVVHGVPAGTEALLRAVRARGLETRIVMHSSMAQHGAEAGEAAMMDLAVRLARQGVVGRLGLVKAGLADTFAALGIPAVHTPNRAPDRRETARVTLRGADPHVGVFGALFWRKNVVTQLGAVALMKGTAHVMERPDIDYLDGMTIVAHGESARDEFLAIQASTAINLYVTLSECHPMGPIESYLDRVPALMSRTSDVFRSDPALWELTTVDRADDPRAIAAAAERLLEHRDEAIPLAHDWIRATDAEARDAWARFVSA